MSEAQEQTMLFDSLAWLVKQYPEVALAYHIPNGGKRNKAEAARLKRQGVKAGVPDICLPVARGGYHGMYIEMKYGRNRPTEAQEIWLEQLEKQGFYTAVCYSAGEAIDKISAYMRMRKPEGGRP